MTLLRLLMKIIFLGTRGEIERRTRRHWMHSSLLLATCECNVMIDCGIDWLNHFDKLRTRPISLLLTHAHPDHAGGLKNGAPCEVFATAETWSKLKNVLIRNRAVILPREPIEIGNLIFVAFPVEHSLIAPAVGYRITHSGNSIFYVPDVAAIPNQAQALSGVSLYIGDGATISRPLVRKRDGVQIGHASIKAQLDWCKQERIPRTIFTHCGSQIVSGDERIITEKVGVLGRELAIDARLAYDGLEITF